MLVVEVVLTSTFVKRPRNTGARYGMIASKPQAESQRGTNLARYKMEFFIRNGSDYLEHFVCISSYANCKAYPQSVWPIDRGEGASERCLPIISLAR